MTESSNFSPTCSICLNSLNSEISALPCGHVFHSSCIKENSKYSTKCPLCKRNYENIINLKLFGIEKIPICASISQKTLEMYTQWKNSNQVFLTRKRLKKGNIRRNKREK